MPTTVWPWHKKRYTGAAFPRFEQAQWTDLPTSQSLAGNTTSLADLPSEQNFGLLGAHAFDYVRRIGCEFVFDHVQTPLFAERIQLAPDTASPMLSTPPSTTCR